MFKDIETADALNLEKAVWIDARSPQEYHDAHVPGAINIPLFDDVERSQIGTVYHDKGKEAATDLAIHLVSPKIPHFIQECRKALTKGEQVVVYCWRGGKRSYTLSAFFDLANIPVFRVTGGYRAYRQYVLERLKNFPYPRFLALHGLTGVGKTLLLHMLEMEGFPVLDLEDLAAHRGSAFGALGEIQPRNQKSFDALLYERLSKLQSAPLVFMEAESKHIGRVTLPDSLLQAKQNGLHVMVTAPLSNRVARILQEYTRELNGSDQGDEQFYRQVEAAILRVKTRLPHPVFAELQTCLANRRYDAIIELLLTHYYDPRYKHAQEQYEHVCKVDAEDLTQAKEALAHLYREHVSSSKIAANPC